MLNTILGTKGKMSQAFIEGFRVPVTKIVAGPCVITQIKKVDPDGYWAVQLGFGEKRTKNITNPLKGHLKAAYKDQNKAARFLREVRVDEEPAGVTGQAVKVGDTIAISDIFNAGDVVTVAGTSKGKGFAGVVKRWDFHGGPRTHGQSDRERAPGSIGATTTPGRVLKGKKMAGRMGNERVTVQNLHVVNVDPENNVLTVSGAIPGVSGGLVTVRKIKAGKLSELEHETVTQKVVEGEITEGTEKSTEGTEKEAAPANA